MRRARAHASTAKKTSESLSSHLVDQLKIKSVWEKSWSAALSSRCYWLVTNANMIASIVQTVSSLTWGKSFQCGCFRNILLQLFGHLWELQKCWDDVVVQKIRFWFHWTWCLCRNWMAWVQNFTLVKFISLTTLKVLYSKRVLVYLRCVQLLALILFQWSVSHLKPLELWWNWSSQKKWLIHHGKQQHKLRDISSLCRFWHNSRVLIKIRL